MSNSEKYYHESVFSNRGGTSGVKTDSEGVQVHDKDLKEILNMMKIFSPYMHEPQKKNV